MTKWKEQVPTPTEEDSDDLWQDAWMLVKIGLVWLVVIAATAVYGRM